MSSLKLDTEGGLFRLMYLVLVGFVQATLSEARSQIFS